MKFSPPDGWKYPEYSVEIQATKHNKLFDTLRTLFPTNNDILNYVIEISNQLLDLLYSRYPTMVQPKKSFKFVMRDFDGIAYVTGSDEKEMHVSFDWLQDLTKDKALDYESMKGVLWHEMVHIWQNSNGMPGGLVEGFADYVRLIAGFPCWQRKPSPNSRWDAGYATTGFFLRWLEVERQFTDLPIALNASIYIKPWSLDLFTTFTGGLEIEDLWWEYQRYLGPVDYIPPNRHHTAELFITGGLFLIRNAHYIISSKDNALEYAVDPVIKEHINWNIIFAKDGAPYYHIVHPSTGKTMDVYGHSYDNGKEVGLWDMNGQDNQQFLIEQRRDGFSVNAKHSGKALDNGLGKVIQYDFHGGSNQVWNIERLDVFDGHYHIYPKNSSQSFQFDPRAPKTHKWRIKEATSPYYTICYDDNLVLDVEGSSTANGAKIILWKHQATKNQEFLITWCIQRGGFLIRTRFGKYFGNNALQAEAKDAIIWDIVKSY